MAEAATAVMPSDIKEENRRSVLLEFHSSTLLTTAEVAEKTGISTQTVKKCIDYYTSNGILVSRGKGTSSKVGGKRPEQFSLNESVRLLCVLLHHTNVSLVVTDLYYERKAYWNSGETVFHNLDAVLSEITRGAQELKGDLKGLAGVCLSAPLGVDAESKMMFAVPFPDWPNSDFGRSLISELSALFPEAKRIVTTGDGRAAGCAMYKHDYDKYKSGDMITYYTSNGIGGSMFNAGSTDQRKMRLVDTIGHIVVKPDDPELCGCGAHGCLEKMVGRERMKKRLAQQPEMYAKSVLAATPVAEMTFDKLFDGSRAGDALCRQEVLYLADMYAAAIRSILLTVQPSFIIFQGDIGRADEAFRTALMDRIRELKFLNILSDMFEIVYDKADLEQEEAEGCAFMLVKDYLENAENYI